MASSIERRIRALEAAASTLLEPSLSMLIAASQGDIQAQQVLSRCNPNAPLLVLIRAAISIHELPTPEPMLAPVSEFVH